MIATSYYKVEVNTGSGWAEVDRNAIRAEGISGVTEGGGNADNGITSGADSSVSFSVPMARSALPDPVPTFMPIRVTYTIENQFGRNTAASAVGRVIGEEETDNDATVRLNCEGLRGILRGVRAFSPRFERTPISIKTNAASPTDPDTAGITPLEWWLLTAGGWPLARDFENADALFYYDLDTAPYAPDYVWLAGEVGWDEFLNLLKAVGGQLYQRSDGVLVYRQPLSFGEAAATWTISDTGAPGATRQLYGRVSRSRSHRKSFTQVRVMFEGRRVYPNAVVQEDTEHRHWNGGEIRSFEILLDKPLYSIETADGLVDIKAGENLTVNVAPAAMIVVDAAGLSVAQTDDPMGTNAYSHNWQVSAQRIIVTINNRTGGPIHLHKLTVKGEVIGAGATGMVIIGTEGVTENIDSNPFIQQYSHAEAVARQTMAFQADPRPIYRIEGLVFNPQLDTGEAILLESRRFDLTSERCVIVSRSHENTGHLMSLDVTPVDDLPKLSDFYKVGTTNYSGQSKRLGW